MKGLEKFHRKLLKKIISYNYIRENKYKHHGSRVKYGWVLEEISRKKYTILTTELLQIALVIQLICGQPRAISLDPPSRHKMPRKPLRSHT